MSGKSNELNCGAFFVSYISFYMTGYYNASALASVRFLAGISNRLYHRWTSRPALLTHIGLSWLIGLGLNVVPYILSPSKDPLYRNNPPFNDCGSTSTVTAFTAVWMFGGNLSPLIGAVLTYAILFIVTEIKRCKLRSMLAPAVDGSLAPPAQNPEGGSHQHPANQAQRRAKLTRVLFISSLWNAICFLPIPLMMITNPIKFYMNLSLQLWLRTLNLFGYAFNPLIFLTLNHDYRKCVSKLVKGQWSQRSPAPMLVGTNSNAGRQGAAAS
ncbi:hypothetical protein RvY_16312 [Ramazzottius varieornatus]|uniref:G-protein coupled receptors family 1 profile domain-containing protein n=1 Tax=Ramazzottius varieornatus TaxID=947166 RepID=A0A1D1W2E4_RAMVA|nr:hypothetical protein RvY_16312 [Ramazzottius varieornatus]